jgi:hypothetical protein
MGCKVQTPSLAAFANPAGNGNPLYTGDTYTKDNVKNTDAFDPGAASSPTIVALTTGKSTTSSAKIAFDGYLKNFVFAYNYVSTGDDDVAMKGSITRVRQAVICQRLMETVMSAATANTVW